MSRATCASSTRAGCSTAATPSPGCGSWTSSAPSASSAPMSRRSGSARLGSTRPGAEDLARSDVATDVPVPTAPFLGEARVVKGIPVRDLVPYLNESALFRGQWQLRGVGGKEGWRHTLETEARPRLRALLDEAIAGQILRPAVVYGYFPC